MIVSAISMRGVPEVIDRLQAIPLARSPIIVSATKGLDPTEFKTPAQLWQAAFPSSSVVVLSGPNLSAEISQGCPAATTAASTNAAAADRVQTLLNSDRFRVYTHADPIGTELGGTLKNAIAIAAGICDSLELGTNAKSALIARGLVEMARIGTYFGAKSETFAGLSGLGDLVATCNSPLSRNYQVGFRLARSESLAEILATLVGTAEGVYTTQAVVKLAEREGLSIPIVWQVHQVLQGVVSPRQALLDLMERGPKTEFHG